MRIAYVTAVSLLVLALPGAGAVKLGVEADGFYQVSGTELRAAGLDLTGVDCWVPCFLDGLTHALQSLSLYTRFPRSAPPAQPMRRRLGCGAMTNER